MDNTATGVDLRSLQNRLPVVQYIAEQLVASLVSLGLARNVGRPRLKGGPNLDVAFDIEATDNWAPTDLGLDLLEFIDPRES